MSLLDFKTSVRAIAALPFPLRKKAVEKYITRQMMTPQSLAALARKESLLYARHYAEVTATRDDFLALPVISDGQLTSLSMHPGGKPETPSKGTYMVRSEEGAWGVFSASDLAILGAGALLHPAADALLATLKRNPLCLNAWPFESSVLGPSAENLVRFLGGCVLNAGKVGHSELARILAETTPSVVLAAADQLLKALMLLRTSSPQRYGVVVDSLQFLFNCSPAGPMSRTRRYLVEKTLSLEVIDLFSDSFSFAWFSCRCGGIHPLPNYFVETVDSNRHPTSPTGRLVVTELTRTAFPIVRYLTPYIVTMKPAPCSFFGQVMAAQCHGIASMVHSTPTGPAGPVDVEDQLAAIGLFAASNLYGKRGQWHVGAIPFDDAAAGVDEAEIAAALSTRFERKVKVSLMKE